MIRKSERGRVWEGAIQATVREGAVGYVLEGSKGGDTGRSEVECIGRDGAWDYRKERGIICRKERGIGTVMKLSCRGRIWTSMREQLRAVPALLVMTKLLLCTVRGLFINTAEYIMTPHPSFSESAGK